MNSGQLFSKSDFWSSIFFRIGIDGFGSGRFGVWMDFGFLFYIFFSKSDFWFSDRD